MAAQFSKHTIPEAIKLRFYSAPAGTALICTTAAVLDAMKPFGLHQKIAVAGNFDLSLVRDMTKEVTADPGKWHKASSAYAKPPMKVAESARLKAANDEATRLAPLTQAFIGVFFRGASLAQAKVIKKHAERAPAVFRAAQGYFRALEKQDADSEPASIAELFTLGPLQDADEEAFWSVVRQIL